MSRICITLRTTLLGVVRVQEGEEEGYDELSFEGGEHCEAWSSCSPSFSLSRKINSATELFTPPCDRSAWTNWSSDWTSCPSFTYWTTCFIATENEHQQVLCHLEFQGVWHPKALCPVSRIFDSSPRAIFHIDSKLHYRFGRILVKCADDAVSSGTITPQR